MTGIVRHERLSSMRLIEEFMLAANEAVAEKLHRARVGALYRIHEQPDPERVEEFVDLVSSLGYRLPGRLDGVRPEDFQLVVVPPVTFHRHEASGRQHRRTRSRGRERRAAVR